MENMTKINLTLAALEDETVRLSNILWQSSLASQRMAERIAHDELELEETPPPPIPKYVPEPKKKLTTVELLQAPKMFIQKYYP